MPPDQSPGGSESKETNERRKVEFDHSVRVILIPSRGEYKQVGLYGCLWWDSFEFSQFQASANNEIRCFAIEEGIGARAARRKLYQPTLDDGQNSGTFVTHSNAGMTIDSKPKPRPLSSLSKHSLSQLSATMTTEAVQKADNSDNDNAGGTSTRTGTAESIEGQEPDQEAENDPWNGLTSPTLASSSSATKSQSQSNIIEFDPTDNESDSDSNIPVAPALVLVPSLELNAKKNTAGSSQNTAQADADLTRTFISEAKAVIGEDFQMTYSSRESDTDTIPSMTPPASPSRDAAKSSSLELESQQCKLSRMSSVENLKQRLDLANENLILNLGTSGGGAESTQSQAQSRSTPALSLSAMKRVSSLDCVKSAMRSEASEFIESECDVPVPICPSEDVCVGSVCGETESAKVVAAVTADKEKESTSWDHLLLCVPMNTFQALRDCRKPRFSPSRQSMDVLELNWLHLLGWGTVIIAMIIMMFDRNSSSEGHSFNSSTDAEGYNNLL